MSALLPILLAATIPLRNPFWPIGHSGERTPISDQPRVVLKAAPEAAKDDDTKTSITAESIAAAEAAARELEGGREERRWIAARKSLKIGSTLKISDGRQAVTINGNVYSDGDRISANHDGYRFTWRVRALTDSGTLKLERLRVRELEQPPPEEKKK